MSAAMRFFFFFFCEVLKNEFEIAMVNKALVFEPSKFYCIFIFYAESVEKDFTTGMLSKFFSL